jgi:O-antigen/teichoic acid export membrane protein
VKEHRLAFFRQSSWVLIATLGGGAFMFLVQAAAQRYMPADELTKETQFGVFMALLNALAQMAIPALGLQTVFVQQTVAAVDTAKQRELSGTIRGVVKVLFVLWAMLAVLALVFQKGLLENYKIQNPAAIWLTVGCALLAMLTPVFVGCLQGRQDFLWFGWGSIMGGFGRFAGVVFFIVLLHKQAAGAMAAVLGSLALVLGIYIWRTRAVWGVEPVAFSWAAWLRRVVPLTVGLGTFTYMLTQDMIVVQRFFTKSDGYGAARVVGAALVFLTTPLAAVMFPKIVRSHHLSEKSNVLWQALGATGLIGALAALACTLMPELPLKLMSRAKFLNSAVLVPWFAWCMVPLAVANVLISNLLARERFAVVPWLVLVAAGYGVTLRFVHSSFVGVIQTLGIFSTLMVLVCVVFTVRPVKQQVEK